MKQPDIIDAILAINPTARVVVRGSEIEWVDGTPEISDDVLSAKKTELLAVWESLEYQRQRQPEYPPLADLADALYWQAQGDESKMTAYLAAVEAVKQKYPKGV